VFSRQVLELLKEKDEWKKFGGIQEWKVGLKQLIRFLKIGLIYPSSLQSCNKYNLSINKLYIDPYGHERVCASIHVCMMGKRLSTSRK
jgi:hypothetical protein